MIDQFNRGRLSIEAFFHFESFLIRLPLIDWKKALIESRP